MKQIIASIAVALGIILSSSAIAKQAEVQVQSGSGASCIWIDGHGYCF